MTTNIERAAEVIVAELAKDPEVYDALFGDEHIAISYALSNAGLLKPDLPKPHALSGRLKLWEHQMHSVTIHPHFGLHLIAEGTYIELTPVEARLIADSLYAAADYAEQEQDNV